MVKRIFWQVVLKKEWRRVWKRKGFEIPLLFITTSIFRNKAECLLCLEVLEGK
jgi:hypothetical protein